MDNNNLDSSGTSRTRRRRGVRGTPSPAAGGASDDIDGSGRKQGRRGGGGVIAIDSSSEVEDDVMRRGSSKQPSPSSSATKNDDDNDDTENNIETATTNDDEDDVVADENEEEEEEEDTRKPLVLLGDKPRGLYECDYCGSDLTRTPRIRCAVCPDFDLCLECFVTEDHEHMAKYKREEEQQRRKDAARIAGVELEEKVEEKPKAQKSKGRGGRGGKRGRKKVVEEPPPPTTNSSTSVKDKDEELGSYVGGIWVPYFRHTPDHGYIVADSTRYTMFPSFRGVRKVETLDVTSDNEGNAGLAKGGVSKEDVAPLLALLAPKANDDADLAKGGVSKEDVAPLLALLAPKANDVKSKEEEKTDSTAMDVDGASQAKDGENSTEKPSDAPASSTSNAIKEMDVDKVVKEDEEKESKANDLVAASSNAAMDVDEKEPTVKGPVAKAPTGEKEAQVDVGEAKEDSNKEGSTMNEKKKEEVGPSSAVDSGKATGPQSNATNKAKTEPLRFRVIDDPKHTWTVEEDLRLLDGILTCGLGNWPEIAEHINNGGVSGDGVGGSGTGAIGEGNNVSGGKTDKQCMERYLDDFMGRYGSILPPYTLVPQPTGEGSTEDDKTEEDSKPAATSVLQTDSSDGESAAAGIAARKRPRRSVSSNVIKELDSAPGFKKTRFRAVPTNELVDERNEIWPHPYVPPTGVKYGDEVGRDLWYRSEQYFIRQITATNSKAEADAIRKEFIERRAKNEPGFEANVLPPRLEDCKKLPGSELAGYMPRRGDFDMEWDNDAEKTIAEMEFTSDDTKDDRELKLDVIRIFNAKLDEREKRKKFIIEQGLLNYRENQEKMWRMAPDERHLIQRMRLFARYHTKEEHEAFVKKIIEAKRLRKEIAKLQMYRRLGIKSLAEAEKYEVDKARREEHRDAWMKKEEEKRKAADDAIRAAKEKGIAPPPPPPVPVPVSAGVVGAAANQSLQVWKKFKTVKKESSEDASASKFVIKDKPGYELLSQKEVGLCKRLRLLPQNYLDVKKALISESLAQGVWNPGGHQKKSIFKIDIHQRDNIIDFVLEAGWIPTRPNTVES